MIHIGIDNGVTGSIAIMRDGVIENVFNTPVFDDYDQLKTKVKHLKLIDCDRLCELLWLNEEDRKQAKAYIERPYVAKLFSVSVESAVRAFEATRIVLMDLGIGYQRIDSKDWQYTFWPRPKKDQTIDTKALSKSFARQLFPEWKDFVDKKTNDGDALLICEWARRNNCVDKIGK